MIPRLILVALLSAFPLAAADTRLVRETEALSSEQERSKLRVPAGFEIQLFAAEPMIHKPINMAFDGRGRLWVSSTVEYPYSADKRRWSDAQGAHVAESRDAIKILEDTDGDGRADKVVDFADQLNIPTGVLPWHKPEHKAGCIAWSIPNIWYFADTDGDDKADVREVLFGPLGFEKDTHGMCSSFRLGLDGWVYATHGFNNTSHFKARDGSTLDLHSGNVFRFRPDGSRIEPWTWGQVNPFGLCWDRYGNLYSADCHSAPIYQLIRGAHYPSFGKPHDGLGYAPVMCEHTHGSTGICGVVYLDGGVWGPEWDDHMFVGNVVTSRVNHDRITFNGSTPKAHEQPDFITSEDPWFRPIDLQLGPDNGLYVADFYNRIIGHYEVPLDHPGRDRERGRIWRVVKKGVTSGPTNFALMGPEALAAEMESPNLTRRRLALHEVRRRGKPQWAQVFVDHLGQQRTGSPVPRGDAVPVNWNSGSEPDDAGARFYPQRMTLGTAYALWACSYLGERAIVSGTLRGMLEGGVFVVDRRPEDGGGNEPLGVIIAHTTRILGSYDTLHPWEMAWLSYLFDSRGWPAARAAAEVLLNRPDFLLPGANQENGFRGWAVVEVLKLYRRMLAPLDPARPAPWENTADTHLIHALRLLLRDFWSQPGVLGHPLVKEGLEEMMREPKWRDAVMPILTAVPTAEVADYLVGRLDKGNMGNPAVWKHLGRHGSAATLAEAMAIARRQTQGDEAAQLQAIEAFHHGLSERGASMSVELLQWAQELAARLLEARKASREPDWEPIAQTAAPPAWSVVLRPCSDGSEASVLQSMGKGGGDEESRSGTLRSKPFAAPATLRFWINGHRGFPNTPAHDKNLVRLVDAESGAAVASVFPPRNDRCAPVEWDLSAHRGKPVCLEIVDGDSGRAYAWLGITRIEPPLISVEAFRSANKSAEHLRSLAPLIIHTAPAALREQLSPYLPRPSAPPAVPVSPGQRRQLDALIASRVAAFGKGRPDRRNGERVFAAQCAACHQIGGKGGLIGPQLDGVGLRGVERLCEDILDPHRNVDAHFHLHVLKLKDGNSLGGFLRGEVGQMLLLVDAAQVEQRVPKAEVVEEQVLPTSLMPPVFGQLIGEREFVDLLGWLLGPQPGR